MLSLLLQYQMLEAWVLYAAYHSLSEHVLIEVAYCTHPADARRPAQGDPTMQDHDKEAFWREYYAASYHERAPIYRVRAGLH